MRSLELEVVNASGLHARAAAAFVKAATGFRSTIHVRHVDREPPGADAKSILGVLLQGVGRGARIEIQADGEDEDEAIETLGRLVEDGLGEGAAAGL